MIRYQGEDIQFSVELNTLAEDSVSSWGEFSSVIVYLYTNESHIVKFRTDASDGYNILSTDGENKILYGTLAKDDTIVMGGALYFDILAKYSSGIVNIKHVATGVTINHAAIKQEVEL